MKDAKISCNCLLKIKVYPVCIRFIIMGNILLPSPSSVTFFVSVHRAPHLLCCRALEVQGVRLRTLRLASAAPCKRLQFDGLL